MAAKYLFPFEPTAQRPFGRKEASHLLRRAGFGASPAEIDAAVKRGLDETVELMFEESPEQQAQLDQLFGALNGHLLNFGDANNCRAWWLYRMTTSPQPLREKLVLFWHGHFAASIDKVGDAELMLNQLELFQKQAWGNFRDLVLGIAQDPAMLVYLDGESNTKEHPNENFARELMELFTCGIGNYAEKDVLEAARAFTGWKRDGAKFQFVAEEHDYGVKKIFGRSGKFDGGDVVDLLMANSATPKFLSAKLVRFFACGNPSPEVLSEAAEALDRAQLNIKVFLRDLFLSDYFFSPACLRTRISSPVEYVVGTIRTLGVRIPSTDYLDLLEGMGQVLLAPHNVKGWDGEQAWINSTTLASRAQFAKMIGELRGEYSRLAPHCPVEELIPYDEMDRTAIVAKLADVLFQGDLPKELRPKLEEFLVTGPEGNAADQFRDDQEFRIVKTRQLLGVLLALPEYQLC